MKNETKYSVLTALYTLVAMMANGAVLQTYLLEMGLSAEVVSVYVSVTQIIQVGVMLSLAGRVEKAKNVIFLTAATMGIQVIMILVLLFFCFFTGISVPVKIGVVYGAGILVNVALGIYNIATYKFPYHVIDMRRYGMVTGISGVAGGTAGIIFSAVLTYFVSQYPYFGVMKIFLGLGIIFSIACFGITVSCEDNGFSLQSEERKKINLFTYKPFWILFIPNLFRGLHGGIFCISIAIGYHLRILDSTSSSVLLVITNVATIVSSLLYSVLARKQIEKWLILIPGVIMLISMPLMVADGSSTVFLVMYTIGYVAFHLINNAVPVALTKVIDYQVIGQYSAWRMTLFSVGTALAGMVCIPLIDLIGAAWVMVIAGIFLMISCGVYFHYIKKMGK